jgi:hypothetical protein
MSYNSPFGNSSSMLDDALSAFMTLLFLYVNKILHVICVYTLQSPHQRLHYPLARERVCPDKRLAVADDLGGDDAYLGLPDVFPDAGGLVGGGVEP